MLLGFHLATVLRMQEKRSGFQTWLSLGLSPLASKAGLTGDLSALLGVSRKGWLGSVLLLSLTLTEPCR